MDKEQRDKVLAASYQNTEEGKEQLYNYEKNKVESVDDIANYNSLTKLPILRMFNFKSSEIVKANPDLKYAVIVMDITRFKAVNEFLGRSEGDRLLLFIADCLNKYVEERSFTVAGHMRADTFCLFTAYIDQSELSDICVNIKRRIKNMFNSFRVIISFGICASRDSSPAIPYLKDCATLALAEVKGKYYADYCFFREEMRTNMLKEKLIESDMMVGLEHGEVVPYIQPKVDMTTGNIIGGEALVRWNKPGEGIKSPAEFIPIIEKTGLIINVDRFMWARIFAYQKRVLDEGRTPVPISVNVSRMHSFEDKLAQRILGMHERYEVPTEYVVLEITESAFALDENNMDDQMKKLRQSGFTISMDDFGSGYSSLNMLRSRELDEVKIDKEFLSDIGNPKSRIVISNLINMLRELKIDMIVEGIETEAQKKFFVDNGCTRAQGFLFYKPMPLDEFDELLKKNS